MSRALALLWLLLTLSPLPCSIFFAMSLKDFRATSLAEEQAHFNDIVQVQMGLMFLVFALIASYVIYIFKTDHVPKEKRALWSVVLFLGHFVAMPVFWFLYVWPPLRAGRA